MKKLFLLLTLVGIIFTACESGGEVEEEVGGEQTLKLELSCSDLYVNYETNIYTVSVTSTCPWTATSNCKWIVIDNESGDAGTKELSFKVESNSEEDDRMGKIIVKNSDYNLAADLFIFQTAYKPTIIAEPKALHFTADGGTEEVAIKANCEYQIIGVDEWIKLTKTDNGIIIEVPANIETEERFGLIVMNNKEYSIDLTIEVMQDGSAPQIDIETETINFAGQGGTQAVAINSNFKYDVSTTVDWLSYAITESGIEIIASNNFNIDGRSGEITISSEKYNLSKTIKVTQDGLTEEEYAKHLITYTSTDGAVIDAANYYRFGANIISNTYENGIGIIRFDAPVALIGEKAFWNCDNLESITIPNSATSIGKNAFINCSGLKNITIGDNVTSIGFGAFSGCISLTGITIGDNVTEIGERAFFNCSSLESVTMGNNVTEIGVSAFENCTSLTSITIPDGVTTMRERVLKSCSSLTSVIIGKGVTTIGDAAFGACVSLTSLEIPDNVTLIEEHAFYSCIGLISITLPNSITEIKKNTFNGCENLISVTIPDSVTIIRERAFDSCGLVSITIGNNVTTIENCAFIWCRSLKNVTISENVTLIGEFAFYACTSLAAVYCKPTTPPTGSSNMFNGNDPDRKIYVPTNSVNAYKREMYWMNYHQYIVGYDF